VPSRLPPRNDSSPSFGRAFALAFSQRSLQNLLAAPLRLPAFRQCLCASPLRRFVATSF
jgi:hypothetical protein